jgi:hypothetical protein
MTKPLLRPRDCDAMRWKSLEKKKSWRCAWSCSTELKRLCVCMCVCVCVCVCVILFVSLREGLGEGERERKRSG